MAVNKASFRFYQELNDFLPEKRRKRSFYYYFNGSPSIKDAIEAIGVPHTEVDLILVNGESVDFGYRLRDGDTVSVYPLFESFDIGSVTRLRPQPLRVPSFIADVHLGKLVKMMRMLGFDTYYENDLDDEQIVRIANRENRIILTRDKGLLKRKDVTHGYWVRSQNPEEQAREVVKRFHLEKLARPFIRCVECNGIIRPVPKEKIEEKLEDKTRKHYSRFYQCDKCGKIYWKGSHMPHMWRKIKNLMKENR